MFLFSTQPSTLFQWQSKVVDPVEPFLPSFLSSLYILLLNLLSSEKSEILLLGNLHQKGSPYLTVGDTLCSFVDLSAGNLNLIKIRSLHLLPIFCQLFITRQIYEIKQKINYISLYHQDEILLI
jgi:hypothetical protein